MLIVPIDNNEYYHIAPFRLVVSNKKSGETITQNLNLRTNAIYEIGSNKPIETNLPGDNRAFSNGALNINKLLIKRSQLIEELAQWAMPPIIEFQKNRTVIYAGESTKDMILLLEKKRH